MNNLLKLHKDSTKKIGDGIKHFVVKEVRKSGNPTKCFGIKRKDGTETHFSYLDR